MSDLPPVACRVSFQRYFGNRVVPRDASPGLVFDRYFRCWQRPGERTSPLLPDLQNFVAEFRDAGPSHAELLADVHRRLDSLVAVRGRRIELRLESRFASGLGTDHPLDNGFSFDRTVGVPYLPGSAVKGLCRAWAKVANGNSEEIAAIFGEEPQDGDDVGSRPGDMVFFSAYPSVWPELAVDMLNNHHRKYYEQGGSPRDVEAPVPIYFLTVQPGSGFAFRFLSQSDSKRHLERTTEWLQSGLENLGVGAKTALGFGVLRAESP